MPFVSFPIQDLPIENLNPGQQALFRTHIGLGNMATQFSGSVSISGGTITGVPANFTSGSLTGVTIDSSTFQNGLIQNSVNLCPGFPVDVSDGFLLGTASSRIVWEPGPAGNLDQASPFTVPIILHNSGPRTGTYGIFYFSGNQSSPNANRAFLCQRVNNDLVITLNGAPNTNKRILTFPGVFTSTNTGYNYLIVTWDRQSAPKAYLNAQLLTGSETTAGTPPAWTDNIDSTYFGVGLGYDGKIILPYGPINSAFSASTVLYVVSTGHIPAYYDRSYADQVGLVSGFLEIGKRYRIETIFGADDFTNVGAPSNANGTEFTATGNSPAVWASGSYLRVIGPVFVPVVQNILIVNDAGTNKIFGRIAGNVQPVTKRSDWVIQARTQTMGNERITDGSVFLPNTAVLIHRWAIWGNSVAAVVSLGPTSGSNLIADSYALRSTFDITDIPIGEHVNGFKSLYNQQNLWVNSDVSDPLDHFISGSVFKL